jgi:hypothetical protein
LINSIKSRSNSKSNVKQAPISNSSTRIPTGKKTSTDALKRKVSSSQESDKEKESNLLKSYGHYASDALKPTASINTSKATANEDLVFSNPMIRKSVKNTVKRSNSRNVSLFHQEKQRS